MVVTVAGAEVSRQAFDRFGVGRGWVSVEDVGDAATFDFARGSLRVLAGSTLFTVMVKGHDQPLEAATALARKALERLGQGPHPPPVS